MPGTFAFHADDLLPSVTFVQWRTSDGLSARKVFYVCKKNVEGQRSLRKGKIREGRLEQKGNNKEHQAFLTRVKRTYEEIKLKLQMHVAIVGLTPSSAQKRDGIAPCFGRAVLYPVVLSPRSTLQRHLTIVDVGSVL